MGAQKICTLVAMASVNRRGRQAAVRAADPQTESLGDARRSTAELGKLAIDMKVDFGGEGDSQPPAVLVISSRERRAAPDEKPA